MYIDINGLPLGKEIPYYHSQIIIHKRSYGVNLVEYMDPETIKRESPWKFWTHTDGGSHSIGKILEEALVGFDKDVEWTKAYWAKRFVEPNMLIINNQMYHDSGYVENGKYLGFGGTEFGVEELASGKQWVINNLWHCGKIPSEFEKADTHKFIPVTVNLVRSSSRASSGPLSSAQQHAAEM